MALAQINKTLNINFFFSAISDESEFGDLNENEVNECPNAILRDFDDYLMDDAGHMATTNDDNVDYNN